MNVIEMIESILSGDANINYLFHHLGQMLDDMDIGDDTILFCKIILSRNDFYYWEFKDKKITTYQQLDSFLTKFFNDLFEGTKIDSRVLDVLVDVFVMTIKFTRYELTVQDIQEILASIKEVSNHEIKNILTQDRIQVFMDFAGFALLINQEGRNEDDDI